ncbi:ROK family transcriptional regulator [Citrobacter sp. Awk 4]|uniref:ROK family transcriptional regulator n=1 Tax=Citrobacter sp. Awk 4 TaxID=2963955 RepID=UPI0023045BDC|nr:ROK family transcriptional regulator [Citrobacter sp. Awk 4]MDA8481028.1 ROK family transcriptional regulator [Citrobacter sp. Awk 4]
MNKKKGFNINDVREANRLSVLRLLATNKMMSRAELARHTGLTKMTLSNLIQDMIAEDLVAESQQLPDDYQTGRKPVLLMISPDSPCILGVLIRRDVLTTVIGDLTGNVIYKNTAEYPAELNNDTLKALISEQYTLALKHTSRRVIGTGISSIGPLDENEGVLLHPPEFGRIYHFNAVKVIGELTEAPVFLINDANAAALAEKLYGIGKACANYIYVHLMNGIGAGLVLNGRIHTGNVGQSGEIGHTSINFEGPFCSCGNRGCLDYYTNIHNLRKRITTQAALNPESRLVQQDAPTLADIIDAAHQKDQLAVSVLEEFCLYLTWSLINTLSLIDSDFIIIGYEKNVAGGLIEETLMLNINNAPGFNENRKVSIVHSVFGGSAPLIGAIAVISEHVFNGQIKLTPGVTLQN